MKRKTKSKVAEKLGVIGILILITSPIGLVIAFISMINSDAIAFFSSLGAALAAVCSGFTFLGFAEICEEIVLIRVALKDIVYNPHSSYTPNKVKFHSTILDDHIETTKEQTQPK